MTLSSYEIIEINAVIITGLLILLSIQVISSDFEKSKTLAENVDSLTYDFHIQKLLVNLCEEYVNDPNSSTFSGSRFAVPKEALDVFENLNSADLDEAMSICTSEKIELAKIRLDLLKAGEIYKDQTERRDRNLDGAPLHFVLMEKFEGFRYVISELFRIYVILPFAIAIVFEIIFSKRKESSSASRLSLYSTIFGIVFLALGLILTSMGPPSYYSLESTYIDT